MKKNESSGSSFRMGKTREELRADPRFAEERKQWEEKRGKLVGVFLELFPEHQNIEKKGTKRTS